MTATSRLLLPSVLLLAAACGGEREETPAPLPPQGGPKPEERLLVVDGITVTFGDLEPFLAYLDRVYPLDSRRVKVNIVLDRHWLPLVLARRAFPEQREEMRARAETLSRLADNVYELRNQAANLPEAGMQTDLSRKALEYPVAAWLFDETIQGKTSPPIEVPQGFKVVAASGLRQSPVVADDKVDAFQVGFYTHDMQSFLDWLGAEKAKVGDKVTYVHPHYREALPQWLKVP